MDYLRKLPQESKTYFGKMFRAILEEFFITLVSFSITVQRYAMRGDPLPYAAYTYKTSKTKSHKKYRQK